MSDVAPSASEAETGRVEDTAIADPGRVFVPDPYRRDFAVLIPAYDEAPVVPDLIRELRKTFRKHGLDGEVILVDDGSSDGTGELALREARGWDAFRVVGHGKNLGKTEAMLSAARATDRSVLIVFDADLQHSPEDIPRFLSVIAQGWDIVCGRKVGAYDKRVVSSIYNRLSRRIFQVPVSDLNSIKAFRAELLDGIHLRHDWHRFFVVLAFAKGWSVTEMDVTLHPRRAGISKYTGSWRVVGGLVDLLSVWFLLIFSRKPLMLFGTLGVAMILAGLVVGIVAIYLRVFHQLGFRPLLELVALLETLGFTAFGFGLLAEMVALVREEVEAVRRRDAG